MNDEQQLALRSFTQKRIPRFIFNACIDEPR
jgi:hypothetical protein